MAFAIASARRPTLRMLTRNRRTLVSAWQAAINEIPVTKILPLGEDSDVAAFLGHKLLSGAVAAAQQVDQSSEQTLERVKRHHRLATANDLMLSQLPALIPALAETDGWDAPTAAVMVDAGVAAVHEGGSGEAVADLARWLLAHAAALDERGGAKSAASSVPAVVDSADAVSRLVELGGSVSTEQVGGSDAEPIFRSIATIGEHSVTIRKAATREFVEQRAAGRLLDSVFSDDY